MDNLFEETKDPLQDLRVVSTIVFDSWNIF